MVEHNYYRYLGKASAGEGSTPRYHLLAYHSLDVAATGYTLLSQKDGLLDDLADLLTLPPESLKRLLTFLLALHDLGKFSAAFQQLPVFSAFPSGLKSPARVYDASTHRHDRLGSYLVEQLFRHGQVDIPSWNYRSVHARKSAVQFSKLMDVMLGHHGKPINARTDGMQAFYCEENIADASAFVADVFNLLDVDIPIEQLVNKEWQDRFTLASWVLAGWAVISDWVGSDQQYFHYCTDVMLVDEYWPIAQQNARRALNATDLIAGIRASDFPGFQALFGFEPTPLQRWAEHVELSEQPQLFILEDITGSGKTEAALTLVHRLMAAKHAKGFYFGLPTMATANAMFHRLADHYLKMFDTSSDRKPSLVLAHSARAMDERFREAVGVQGADDSAYDHDDETASLYCNHWLADSRKKALLAPVGVGTIDQALLGVLPRKHQSLRVLGLHHKVLVFDEVHSADAYQLQLLETLLKLHLHQGGSAILLTATLSFDARERLCRIWNEVPVSSWGKPLRGPWLTQSRRLDAFPLATRVAKGSIPDEASVGGRAAVSRRVDVDFLHDVELVIQQLLAAAKAGRCVVWVRNSVGDAQQAYDTINQRLADSPSDSVCSCETLLFHSRFTLHDRQRIERQVLHWIGKASQPVHRAGKIIVCTQVFQESLDADADLLITDLCPIDDLIQRAGRLHRHFRQYRLGEPPKLLVYSPEWQEQPGLDWLQQDFRATQAVYQSPASLWMAMKVLREEGGYRMPDDARRLIESVYGELAPALPEAFETIELEYRTAQRRKASAGQIRRISIEQGYSWGVDGDWPEDQSDLSTRYQEVDQDSLVLVRRVDDQLIPWVTDAQFAIELSTVKLASNKRKQLTALLGPSDGKSGSPDVLDFLQRYRNARYQYLWLAEEDEVMRYCMESGVIAGVINKS
ncbi:MULTISPECIES: CRISPR-associated helicase Cas3' [unclassified Oceanobacter]|uniref:CRISPR-associated helicase Cas3' n=1 Tax=unclassified Oceanobacter TaxID=2620260 RepID=UPI0026E3E400|nr:MULTISPECIES: CRISPR-associated helicase Cas3' [unclassified Oceanobacter]MDO6681053.1 CRISPR-associated helicase Cas3' [Oceanobacter sp. 5_MG-2023]MDP2504375.1 CRISPR-associated helicase Cas3' [Oceanobacter sp. 3_MG-2023]